MLHSTPASARRSTLSPEASFADHGPALVVFSGGACWHQAEGEQSSSLSKHFPFLAPLQAKRREVSIAAARPAMLPAGTAFNSVAGHMRAFTTRVAHVLPVSDDGGSTAEIVRVLGGPAVGDIRSRCLRLADAVDAEVGGRGVSQGNCF